MDLCWETTSSESKGDLGTTLASQLGAPTSSPLQMINVRTSKSGRVYSPGVLLGNWFEDVCLEEESLKDFLYKRENGELIIQKSRRLKDALYKKEQLSISKDGFIHFGDTVLFMNLDVTRLLEEKAFIMGGNLSLAVNPDISTLYTGDNLSAPCDLSAISHVNPVGRNAFRILSLEGEAMGEPVRFGQNFGLGTAGGFQDKMLFLASDSRSFHNMAKKSSLQPVFMTDELSYLCAWQVTFLDPQLRLEYEGLPIPANTKVVIVHSHTNQALAVPRTFWIRTYFGKECEVNCHTYLDSHKAEESKNHWVIVTGNPSDESTTIKIGPGGGGRGGGKKHDVDDDEEEEEEENKEEIQESTRDPGGGVVLLTYLSAILKKPEGQSIFLEDLITVFPDGLRSRISSVLQQFYIV
ncbi:putative protein C15orf26 like [Crotalus adamanteus]|uniref:Cilia- and flagella-associated protein 161 n=1 Tax=Crotalus adamanteus TaxID=8729 RepID=A0AAW1AX20_CROAD